MLVIPSEDPPMIKKKNIAWKFYRLLSTVITVLPLKVHVILKIRELDDENWIIYLVPYNKHCCADQSRFCSHICSCRKFNLEGIGVCKTFCTTSSPCLGNFSNNFSSRTFDLKLILSKFLNLKLKTLRFRTWNCTSPPQLHGIQGPDMS